MKTVICVEPGKLEFVERPEPAAPAAGFATVDIKHVGICGTDYHIFEGKHPFLEYPRVMGHELSGVVSAVGEGVALRVGTPVVINPYIACGHCVACRKNKPNCCTAVRVLGVHTDGGMAEKIVMPAGNLYPAEGLSLRDAAMVEFLAIGAHAVRRAQPEGGRALVVGIGPIGLGGAIFARIAGLESKTSKPAPPVADPAAAGRMEQIEKSVAALRGELAAARTQADRLASTVNELKAQPRDGSAPAAAPVDLSPLNERIGQIERAAKAQETEISALKAAEAKPVDTKPADDVALRRLVAASLLDVSVRHGDPFAAQLATAKPLAANADALKPLETFAASGVPSAPALCRELVTIVPKLAPSAPEAETTGSSGIVDRLQAGAAKLVRIQRVDATGTDRASVVARVTAAALRNDLNEARRELMTLAPADRAAAQAWLDRADARDAALAASRKFASDAMTALATAR